MNDRFKFTESNMDKLVDWLSCAFSIDYENSTTVIKLLNPRGVQIARYGDIIVKDENNNYYIIKENEI